MALIIMMMRVTAFIIGQGAIPDLLWEETHKGVDTRGVRLTKGRLESWLPHLIRDAFSDYSIYDGLNACVSPPGCTLLPKSYTEALTLQCDCLKKGSN